MSLTTLDSLGHHFRKEDVFLNVQLREPIYCTSLSTETVPVFVLDPELGSTNLSSNCSLLSVPWGVNSNLAYCSLSPPAPASAQVLCQRKKGNCDIKCCLKQPYVRFYLEIIGFRIILVVHLTSKKANGFCFFPTIHRKHLFWENVSLASVYEILPKRWLALQQQQMHMYSCPL